MGIYDLPAMIDFVLNFTNSEKLFNVGVSLGCSILMVLLSIRPEYNQKIIQTHLTGPAVFMGNSTNQFLKQNGQALIKGFTRHKLLDLLPFIDIAKDFMQKNCNENIPLGLAACTALLYAGAGPNKYKREVDIEALKKVPKMFTPFVSVRQANHLLQLMSTGKFQYYEFGVENLKFYGQKNPPEYNLKNMKVPVHIYSGGQDIVTPKMVISCSYSDRHELKFGQQGSIKIFI